MKEFFTRHAAFGQARGVAYLGFGTATVADCMRAGQWERAEALLLLPLAATEQATLDGGRWGAAWLLTHLPEPPWAQVSQQPPHSGLLEGWRILHGPQRQWRAPKTQQPWRSSAAELPEPPSQRPRRPFRKAANAGWGKHPRAAAGGRGARTSPRPPSEGLRPRAILWPQLALAPCT